ncbi:MAG: hypothetical protein HYZ33_04930, partial [Ignavibacteriales bacterium]|nr:hypothetical protein [Ignavibacteriales bacterium]
MNDNEVKELYRLRLHSNVTQHGTESVLIFSIVLFILLSGCSCNENIVKPPEPSIQMNLESYSTYSVKLKIRLGDNNEPKNIELRRDTQIIYSSRLTSRETLFEDKNILQQESYTYKAFRKDTSGITDSSNSINITIGNGWRVDTLNPPHQLTLQHLWGIQSNYILAVGHNSDNSRTIWEWDGKKWNVFEPIIGTIHQGASDMYGVWGESENDFWVAGEQLFSIFDSSLNPPNFRVQDSAFIGHWNGITWIKQNIHYGRTLFSIWGSSNSDIYAGGWKGSLYHYDGSFWKK